jgi:hypothetical protein
MLAKIINPGDVTIEIEEGDGGWINLIFEELD